MPPGQCQSPPPAPEASLLMPSLERVRSQRARVNNKQKDCSATTCLLQGFSWLRFDCTVSGEIKGSRGDKGSDFREVPIITQCSKTFYHRRENRQQRLKMCSINCTARWPDLQRVDEQTAHPAERPSGVENLLKYSVY